MPIVKQAESAARRSRTRRAVRALYLLLLVALVAQVGWLVQRRGFATFSIYSHSMQPTLRPGDELLGTSVSMWTPRIRRGALVAFEPPVLPPSPELAVKRVVALPGDEVSIRDGIVLVDGRAVRAAPPDWFRGAMLNGFGPYVMPEGSVFVLGDNPAGSEDSAVFGPIAMDRIRFVVWLRYRPWKHRCSFEAPFLFPECERPATAPHEL